MSESRIDDIMKRLDVPQKKNKGSLKDLKVLSISEAARLKGINSGMLGDAIANKELKARSNGGGGWIIKRADLDKYANSIRSKMEAMYTAKFEDGTFKKLSGLKKAKEKALEEARETITSLESDLAALERTIGMMSS